MNSQLSLDSPRLPMWISYRRTGGLLALFTLAIAALTVAIVAVGVAVVVMLGTVALAAAKLIVRVIKPASGGRRTAAKTASWLPVTVDVTAVNPTASVDSGDLIRIDRGKG